MSAFATTAHRIVLGCICALATLGLSSCQPSGNAAVDPALSAPASAPAEQAGSLVLADASGAPVWTLRIDGSHIEIALASGQRLLGEQRGDKRRYRDAGDGSELFEVKAKDDGFKLRTPDSRLLWKLKLGDDKIKLSDNEENASPYTLKTGYDDKVKLVGPDDRELGEVKFYGDRSKVKDADGNERYGIDSTRRSAAFALALIDGIPEAQRAVIAAELLARGR